VVVRCDRFLFSPLPQLHREAVGLLLDTEDDLLAQLGKHGKQEFVIKIVMTMCQQSFKENHVILMQTRP
jgi:hypothetical protein